MPGASGVVVVPPHEEADVFLRRLDPTSGLEVRVVFMLVSTKIDKVTCHAVSSAYLTRVPVTIIAYGENYTHIEKPSYFLRTAELAGLMDEDVVVQFDSDAVLTGMDPIPFLDEFISDSPSSLDVLDAMAVRTGAQMAPFLVSAESDCYTPQFSHGLCFGAFWSMQSSTDSYARHHNFSYGRRTNTTSLPQRYVNGGVAIARVWAMREVVHAIKRYTATITPGGKEPTKREWFCDQTVLSALYLSLREWEVYSDILRAPPEVSRTIASPYGLHPGVLGLDHLNQLSATLSGTNDMNYELTTVEWIRAANRSIPPIKETMQRRLFCGFLRRAIEQVHGVPTDPLRTNGNFSPPLLAVKARRNDWVAEGRLQRVFPIIAHFAGYEAKNKFTQQRRCLQYMQWFAPAVFGGKPRDDALSYLADKPLEVWSLSERRRFRFADACEMPL